jgi:putative ATPase
MKDLAYGKNYRYAHNEAEAVSDMDCLPPNLQGRKFYEPTERGFEREIKRRLEGWEEIKNRRRAEERTRKSERPGRDD